MLDAISTQSISLKTVRKVTIKCTLTLFLTLSFPLQSMITQKAAAPGGNDIVSILARALLERRNDMREEQQEQEEEEVWDDQ